MRGDAARGDLPPLPSPDPGPDGPTLVSLGEGEGDGRGGGGGRGGKSRALERGGDRGAEVDGRSAARTSARAVRLRALSRDVPPEDAAAPGPRPCVSALRLGRRKGRVSTVSPPSTPALLNLLPRKRGESRAPPLPPEARPRPSLRRRAPSQAPRLTF